MPAGAQHRGDGDGSGASSQRDAQRRQRESRSGNSAGDHGGRAAGSAGGSREAGSSPNSPRSRASLDEQVAAARRQGKQDKDACKLHLVLTYVQVCSWPQLAPHHAPDTLQQPCCVGRPYAAHMPTNCTSCCQITCYGQVHGVRNWARLLLA